MKERYITLKDVVYWVDLDRYTVNTPVYKVACGYYLGTYAMGTYVKHIVSPSITGCVVRHIDPQLVFTSEADAKKMMEKMNNESMESN